MRTGSSRPQAVEAEEEVVDRQDLYLAEACLARVVPERVRAHHRARLRGGRVGHAYWQAVEDAPAVHHPLDVVLLSETLTHALIDDEHGALVAGQAAHRPQGADGVRH